MYYHHNHNHNRTRLALLENALAKANTDGVKAILLHQINQIKRAEAQFQAKMKQDAYEQMFGTDEDSVELVVEPVEDKPKKIRKPRKKKEEVTE